jgi:hypothetical protein
MSLTLVVSSAEQLTDVVYKGILDTRRVALALCKAGIKASSSWSSERSWVSCWGSVERSIVSLALSSSFAAIWASLYCIASCASISGAGSASRCACAGFETLWVGSSWDNCRDTGASLIISYKVAAALCWERRGGNRVEHTFVDAIYHAKEERETGSVGLTLSLTVGCRSDSRWL